MPEVEARPATPAASPGTLEQQPEPQQPAAAPDMESLAQQVYLQLRRRLRVEVERLRGGVR
jgi:hypothetical protein